MFIPREIAQNLVLALGPLRRLAQRAHDTGGNQNPAKTEERFALLRSLASFDLADARVLELGPGRGTALMRMAVDQVGSYSAFDVEPYLDPSDMARLGVDHRVDASGALPWPDGAFDVVWSNSVLEHIRHPSDTLREVHRVLRPGGLHIAEIDLADHYGDRTDPREIYGFLQYSERLWGWMTSNRSSYCNRLRASEWRDLVSRLGFDIVTEHVQLSHVPLEALREVPFLRTVSDEDLVAEKLTLVMQRAELSVSHR